MTIELILNLTLLVALSVLSGFFDKRWSRSTRQGALTQGFLFGVVALFGMLHPLTLGPGLIFDGRSIMISLCALFFGPLATLVAALLPGVYRLSLGGDGVIMGVSVILASGGIGLLAYYRQKSAPRPFTMWRLYLLGLLVHLAMLALTFTLPGDMAWEVLRHIGLPIILFYPLATVLAGKVLLDQLENLRSLALLRESDEKHRVLLEESSDPVFSFSLDGRYTYVNRAFAKGVGKTPQEIIGKRIEDVFPLEEARKRFAVLSQVFQSGEEKVFEVRVPRPDTDRYYVTTVTPIKDAAATVLSVICSSKDITERKSAELEKAKLESQLQQALKMEAVGRLAGGVAHDFNNQLTGISGFVSLALMNLAPDDPLTEMLLQIKKAADSSAVLTRQLLAFSRKQLIEPQIIDLNDTLASTHKMLARLIGENITLTTVAGENLGAVNVDPGQFEQILVNLVINARDAMSDGGELLIETANVELDESYCLAHPHAKPGPYVMLAVSDNGLGMDPEVQEHIFEPFFTTKAKGRGTGLGLATIYGTVKQAGGMIEVYSEEGQGTTFKIYLPRVAQQAKRPTVERPRAGGVIGGSERVLLVEDEQIVRDLAENILKRLGYQVLSAANGQEACALVEGDPRPIDLLLTDVVMPGMNGRELAQRLAASHPEMKVLYSSGYTENAITHHGIIDAELNFIGKPYSPQALAKKLRDVLEAEG